MAASTAGRLRRLLVLLVQWWLLCFAGLILGLVSPYAPLYEPASAGCQNPELPPGQSGLKVLVYGPSKVATKEIMVSLHELGVRNAYHSEDFLWVIWHRLVEGLWRARGARPAAGRPPASADLFAGSATDLDLQALQGIGEGALASAISRCQVQALSFDGMEELFWPVYRASPGAKVISMSWRTYPAWRRSWEAFKVRSFLFTLFMGLWTSPINLLPSGAALLWLLERLRGDLVGRWLSAGAPALVAGDMGIEHMLFLYQTIPLWYLPHTDAGLRYTPADAAAYDEYFAEARRRIPEQDLLEFDVTRHTVKDLCRFLSLNGTGAAPCSDEPLRRSAPNYGWIEWRHPRAAAGAACLFAALHALQLLALRRAWRAARAVCCWWRRPATERAKAE